jgi:predicted ATP-binding protein involved in virulence
VLGGMMKKSSTIRALENKARKNDMNALFQLAQYYEEGKDVDKDLEQAEAYFTRVLTLFQTQSLQISSLKLADFRGFESIFIDFTNKDNSNLTVIIGNNGAGKTAILEAVKKSLSWIIKNILNQRDSGTGELIDELDINNNSVAEYASIVTKYSVVSGDDYRLELSKAKKNIKSTRKGYYQEIKLLAEIYKLANVRDNQLNFPIMGYYSIERADEISKKDTQPFDEVSEQNSWDKFDGYDKALNGAADFKLFFRWFKYLEDCSNAAVAKQNQKILTEITKLQAELEGDLIKEMQRQARLDSKANDFLISFKQKKQEELSRLQKQITPSPTNKIIESVIRVISEFMPEFKNLRIQRQPLAMLIDKNGISLNIRQLSQGEKSLLALVADIARRLVLLNPSLDDPLQGNGIVLIDEIDLHLHPKWQQSVIPSLQKTFPNIQFIITTHSPQVLSTVNSKCIRRLKQNEEQKIIVDIPEVQSQGFASTDVMAMQMDTDPIPDIKEAKMLSQYKAMIQEDLHIINGKNYVNNSMNILVLITLKF